MARKNRRKASVDSDSSSMRKKRSAGPKPNTFKKMEAAKDFAYEKARIKKRMIISTDDKSYQVLREVSEGMFGYLYEVKEKGGEIFYLRTEPRTTDKDMERFKVLKYEEIILMKALLPKNAAFNKLPRMYDSGATENFKFLVMQPLGETLHDISRIHLKSAFSMSTALRAGIQTLQAVAALHTVGFLHRGLSPMSFFVGAGPKMRNIYMADFGVPYSFRNEESGQIKKPRPYVPMMGVLNYMARASHEEKEHCRRDDLESWMYMTMEFFDLKILPWSKCRNISEVLRKKQKAINGDYSSIFEKTSLRFGNIIRYISSLEFHARPRYQHIREILHDIRKSKNVDFKIPYDWEVFSGMRNKLEADPITNLIPDHLRAKSPAPNSDLYVVPRNEVSKEESAYSPNPKSVGSETSNEQNTPSKPEIAQIKAKPGAKKSDGNPKSEYFIPMVDSRILSAKPKENQSAEVNKNDGSPKSDDEGDERH